MKAIHKLVIATCGLTALALAPLRAENLAELLEEAELGSLIGTWVDPDTKGDNVTVTYAWRVKDHALGLSVTTPERTSEALIGVNPKTGEVFHTTVNSDGWAGLGKWSEEDGLATLNLTMVKPDGEETKLKITHKIVDNKELVVGMKVDGTDEGGEFTLVRKPE